MGEFTQEERERAAIGVCRLLYPHAPEEHIKAFADWDFLQGGIGRTSSIMLILQMELNRANAAIAEAQALLEVYEEARQSSAWLDRRHLWLSKHAEPAK